MAMRKRPSFSALCYPTLRTTPSFDRSRSVSPSTSAASSTVDRSNRLPRAQSGNRSAVRPFREVERHNQTLRIVSALIREYRVSPFQQPKFTDRTVQGNLV
jgi:hypothetical protein